MKRVFNSKMTVHVYCQQSQDDGRNGNNTISFRGDTLYSYAARIARIVPAHITGQIMLVTNRDYSVTTRQHIGQAIRAWEGNFIRVKTLGDRYDNGPLTPEEHESNLSALEEQYRARVERIIRMVSEPWSSYQDMLIDAAQPASDYARAFNLRFTNIDTSADLSRILDNRAKREKRRNQPAVKQRREWKEQAQRAKQARLEKEREQRRLNALLDNAEKIVRWRAGEAVTLPYDAQHTENNSAMLRVDKINERVQTSLGAEVPLHQAGLAYLLVKRCRDANEGWTPLEGQSVKLGHFSLDKVDGDGNIKAGCHYIAWTEIERIAMEMGW